MEEKTKELDMLLVQWIINVFKHALNKGNSFRQVSYLHINVKFVATNQ